MSEPLGTARAPIGALSPAGLGVEPDASEVEKLYAGISDPVQRQRALELLRSLAAPEAGAGNTTGPIARRLAPSQSRARILLVDDDSDILVSIGGWLEAENMEVVRADSASEALRLLSLYDVIDAVVTDVMMPGMSGVEFLTVTRRTRPALPALVITGYAEFAGAGDLPADVAVMRKPFRRKEFVARVESMISAFAARQPHG